MSPSQDIANVPTYQVVIEATAWRQLMALPRVLQERILTAIEVLESQARPAGCKKLVGKSESYRLRVGDYRVIYQIRDSELLVLIVKVAHRRDSYR